MVAEQGVVHFVAFFCLKDGGSCVFRGCVMSRFFWMSVIWVGIMGALDVAAEQTGLGPAPEGSFSVVVFPDTQEYLDDGKGGLRNPVFEAHVKWVLENLKTQRIAFVSHVGDIVDKNVEQQWAAAQKCLEPLIGQVPLGLSVGNHDMKSQGDSTLFQKHFPASKFEKFAWYGGSFAGDPERPGHSGNNANSYQLFSAEGLDLVFLHLECNAPDNVLAWADGVLEKHKDRIALITTHMDLGPLQRPARAGDYYVAPKGRMVWSKMHGERGNSSQQMWDRCFSKHKNVLMLFCGDQRRSTAMRLESKGVHGNTVVSNLSDYSPLSQKLVDDLRSVSPEVPEKLKRWDPLRVYRFLPKEGRIEAYSYDTSQGQLIDATATVPDRDEHQYVIKHDFGR